jgi:hypothetical protein
MEAERRRRAGHYEILGETYAKFEFFQKGWNPYSRFLDVDKVDLILRRTRERTPEYREVQVKFGKLYRVGPAWERQLFDVTSWRFFSDHEFTNSLPSLFIAYILSEDDQYRGDLFLFPVAAFSRIVQAAPLVGGDKRRVYISRDFREPDRWYLRRRAQFNEISDKTCLEVTEYRRNFGLLESAALGAVVGT